MGGASRVDGVSVVPRWRGSFGLLKRRKHVRPRPGNEDLSRQRAGGHAQGLRRTVRPGAGSVRAGSAERALVSVHQSQAHQIEALVWDGSGLWVCAKRLERGRFHWPQTSGACTVLMRPEELAMLVNGVDLAEARPRRNWHRRAPAA